MNIFYLDSSPKLCAEYHCDKHFKMVVEYAQILSTTHRIIDGNPVAGQTKTGRRKTFYSLPDSRDTNVYLATHINHPSTAWVRQSSKHYEWLYAMWRELMTEYTNRYGKQHACEKLIDHLKPLPKNINNSKDFTEPPPAMPDYCKVPGDAISSYRNYYIKEKSRFATWKTKQPEWFVEGMKHSANV